MGGVRGIGGSGPRASLAGSGLLLSLVLAIAIGSGASSQARTPDAAVDPRAAAAERPNVVVLISDDQTQASQSSMTRTNRLIGGRGATFPTSVTNWPLCCPSRATLLTGQYAHNHRVLGNAAPFGGFSSLDTAETLPVWLQRAGYYTAHVGKFLNGYEASPVGVPPGWSEWHGSKRTYTFYGYRLLEDGQENTYGSPSEDPDNPSAPGLYSTDVFTDKAVDLINRRAPDEQPFFLNVAYLAPHSGGPNPDPPNESRCNGTAKPAARHIGALDGEPLPQPPGFNEADVSDKPAGIAGRPPLTDQEIATITRRFRCRGESLLAIDEGVERIVEAVRASGELENTLIIYTSDNGFFHGEHRIQNGKNRVYEEAIRVPLQIRGPGIPAGVSVDELAINADLAPTILDAAGADPGLALDGASLIPSAAHPKRLQGRELLIEQASGTDDDDGVNGVFYAAIRNARYSYVANESGEIELYDLDSDPYELDNLHGAPSYAQAEAALAARLAGLRSCAGESCRTRPALRLKLPRPVREDGRSCLGPKRLLARVRGQGTRGLLEARFAVGAEPAGKDRAAPFKLRIRPRLVRGKRRPSIRVAAELVDGRRLTLQVRARICR